MREDIGVNNAISAGLALLDSITNAARECLGKLFVIRTSDYLLAGVLSKYPLGEQASGAALAVAGRHIDYSNFLLLLVGFLEREAELFEIVAPFHVEVGGEQFTEVPELAAGKLQVGLVLDFFVLGFG